MFAASMLLVKVALMILPGIVPGNSNIYSQLNTLPIDVVISMVVKSIPCITLVFTSSCCTDGSL